MRCGIALRRRYDGGAFTLQDSLAVHLAGFFGWFFALGDSRVFRPRSSQHRAPMGSANFAWLSRRLLCCAAAVLTALAMLPAVAQTGEWVWRGGSNSIPPPATCESNASYIGGGGCGQPGVYGQQGQPSPANIPGGRNAVVRWTTPDGKFWLYGGGGVDGAGNWAFLNDLWEFDPEQDEWTWINGSRTASCQPRGNLFYCAQSSISGSQGVPAAGNTPGGRDFATGWTDPSGNLWLFGGEGGVNGPFGSLLGDLWKFDLGIGEWTWVNGSTTAATLPVYGSFGVASATNSPGARSLAASWTDADGDLWLFGGTTQNTAAANDLWKFEPSIGEWTWMGGGDNGTTCASTTGVCGEPGVYGQIGVASASNFPGGRWYEVTWTDSQGNFWLFGGWGFDSAGTFGFLNDLWKYTPVTNEWTWVSGSDTIPACVPASQDCGEPGSYGNIGVPNPGNYPGSRYLAAGAVDNSGQNYWLFGGGGYTSTGPCCSYLDDLWEYSPASNEWTWVGGNDTAYQTISYGVLGTPAASNLPGGREASAAWVDSNGNFWAFGGSGLDSRETSGWLNDMWEFMPNPSVSIPAPTLTPALGTYTSPQTVTITDSAPGAVIYYTTSGTSPTTASPVYSTPLTVSASETIEAIAVVPSGSSSAVAGGLYTILLPTASPTFNPPAGAYTSTQSVTISDSTPGATIYYAINATPTTSSPQYTAPITVSSSETIEAIAVAAGDSNSAVASAAYIINLAQPGFTLSGVPGAVTLSAGATGTYSLTITPQNGFNGIVSFACSGLPAGASCAFNPSTVSPVTAPASTQLTLKTSARSAANDRTGSRGSLPTLALAGLFGLFGWKRRRSLRLLVVFAAALAGLGMISGCSASLLDSSQPATSAVTVTAVSGALEQSATISLTVK